MRAKIVATSIALLAASASCHRSPAPVPPTTRPVEVEIPRVEGPPITTRLSSLGCSVLLPGSWLRVSVPELSDDSWAAEASDGTDALSVMSMPWHTDDPPSQWRESLDAVLNIRREADLEQHAVGATLSEPEFFSHPTSPSEFYTSYHPVTGARIATMVRASQKLLCVIFLRSDGSTPERFLEYARSVLKGTEVDP